jgi:hypothetical protein
MEKTEVRAFDPVRYCVFTTIALIAWIASPPVAVAWTSGLGLWGYSKAYRAGLRRSKCVLGDVRVVMGYLGLAFAFGVFFTGHAVLRFLD